MTDAKLRELERRFKETGAVEDEAAILSGQWIEYLEASFADYATGDRPTDKKMKEKLDALSADDVTALIQYYASQQ